MISRGLSYFGVICLHILSFLPMQVLYGFASVVYLLLYYVFGYRRKVVRENLVNAFPEKDSYEIDLLEKRFFKYLSALIFEIIKLSSISKKELQRRYVCKNTDLINSYLSRGESVLVCSAHYGNWEWGTQAFALHMQADTYAIYKPLTNKIFENWFSRMRARFANRMIPMRQTFRALSDTKNVTTVFCFGNDQAPIKEESHYWMEFLNQQTSFQLGIEKIALKTNRPVFYIKVKVLKKGYYEIDCVPICLQPEKTNGHEITDLHVRFLENLIKEDPAYWLWSHRRWKHQPTQPPLV